MLPLKMNEIKNILGKELDNDSKLKIKEMGPPRPDLSMTRTYTAVNRHYTRHFTRSVYDKCSWICGCSERNSLFCFPCTLFGSNDMWATTGLADLHHVSDRIKKHSSARMHLNNELHMALLGPADIRKLLADDHLLAARKHYDQVDKNRYIISQIIDYIKFCGAHELLQTVAGERNSAGLLQGFMHLNCSLNIVVKEHISNLNIFEGSYQTIQNDILDAIVHVMQSHIQSEIEETEYLSIQVDEITETVCTKQISVIFRYEREGEVQERFWGFIPSEDKEAVEIGTAIVKILSKLGVDKQPAKLIGQIYDGSTFLSGFQGSVLTVLKDKFPTAKFIHSYAHKGNLLVQQMASTCKQASIFFADLEVIPPFLNQASNRMDILTDVAKKNNHTVMQTQWDNNKSLVNMVHDCIPSLKECFEIVREKSEDKRTISHASCLIRSLEDADFLFWLDFFNKLMPHVNVFFNCIEKKNVSPNNIQNWLQNFGTAVNNIRKALIHSRTSGLTTASLAKRKHFENYSNILSAESICDSVVNQLNSRFQFTEHLSASLLLVPKCFEKHHRVFPVKDFENAVEEFTHIQQGKLRTELEVLYSREELRSLLGTMSLLHFITKKNLNSAFSETLKLLKIVITLPMATEELDRCFTTLDNVKLVLKSIKRENNLGAVVMLLTAKQLIHSIPNFNQKVTEEFAKLSNRSMDFNYI